MERDRLLQMQAFMLRVNATLNAIPDPESGLKNEWRGERLDVQGLRQAYRDLPVECQDVLARGYHMCMHVLQCQADIAQAAANAQRTMFLDILRLSTHERVPYLNLVPDAPGELVGQRPNESGTDLSGAEHRAHGRGSRVIHLADHRPSTSSERERPVATAVVPVDEERPPDRRRWYVAAGVMVMMIAMLALGWGRWRASQAPAVVSATPVFTPGEIAIVKDWVDDASVLLEDIERAAAGTLTDMFIVDVHEMTRPTDLEQDDDGMPVPDSKDDDNGDDDTDTAADIPGDVHKAHESSQGSADADLPGEFSTRDKVVAPAELE